MVEGRRRKGDADALRQRAFAEFDAASGRSAAEARAATESAERSWAEALDAARGAEEALAQAGQELDMGLSIDPGRVEMRGRLGDALVERIELAEWFHQRERREDLARRLALYNKEGTRRRWLEAPPRLSIETALAGAGGAGLAALSGDGDRAGGRARVHGMAARDRAPSGGTAV